MIDAEVGDRIAALERIADGNWTILYRDPSSGELWELFFPQGEMHGGGPRYLRQLSTDEAAKSYPDVSL